MGALLFSACQNDRWEIDPEVVDQSATFHHFADAYFETPLDEFYGAIPELKEKYPFFFLTGDSLEWRDIRASSDMIELWQDSKIAFTAERRALLEEQIKDGFERYYYFFPSTESQDIYTYISYLSLNMPVVFMPESNSSVIALDAYLGSDHPAYRSLMIPQYISRRYTPDYVAPDLFEEYAKHQMPEESDNPTLLDDMVRLGIMRYFQTVILPDTEQRILFGYTADELQFCEKNEVNIWTYFVNQQLLFDTSLQSKQRFVTEAPFSKFNTDIDNATPGRIAEWVGFNIVKSYMDSHKDVTLPELLATEDYARLFRESKYKP